MSLAHSPAAGGPDAPTDPQTVTQRDPERPRVTALAIAGPPDDPELAAGLRPELVRYLESRGVTVLEDAPSRLFVVVGVDQEAPDVFAVDLRLEHDDKATEFYLPSECVRCGSAELLELLVRRVSNVVPQIAELDPPKPSVVPDPPPPPPPPPATVPQPRLAPQGIAGAALLAGGAASIATGAVLWSKRVADHPTDPAMELKLRPPAVALMAVGGAGLVTGAVLLGLELAKPKVRHVSASPILSPSMAGVSMRGRF